MNKTVFCAAIGVLLVMVGFGLGLCAWLINPLDHTAWRVRVHLPILGATFIRAYPLLQLVTTTHARTLLNGAHWQNSHGLLHLHNEADTIRISCVPCNFHFARLSKQPLHFDQLSLTVQRFNHKLSGELTLNSGPAINRIAYDGIFDRQGIALNWSLPKTALSALLHPLQSHSLALQKAHVIGTFSATGQLQWPSGLWRATPVLQGFEVAGLGTETLKTAVFNYRCQTNATKQRFGYDTWVTGKNRGRWLPKAVLIAEDAYFWQHPGYNLDVIRLLLKQVNSHQPQGGSTITQQLAKYMYTGGARLWLRKLEELLYAVEMENTLGKKWILDAYLNTVDWGPGICGAGQAAMFYFGRAPAQLNPVQAAWLAGIIRNPHQAWQQEYLLQAPEFKRLEWVLDYIKPKKTPATSKVQHLTKALKFVKPQAHAVSLASN